MALDSTQKSSRLFKKYFGLAETITARDFFEESNIGQTLVLPSQIWAEAEDIPATAPILTDGQISGVIQYYEKLELTHIPGSQDRSFKDDRLKDALDFTVDASYNYKLYKNDGTTVIADGQGDWLVDREAGVLSFYGTLPAGVTAAAPPKISFYKYVGVKGLQTNGATSGINVKDPVVAASTVNISNYSDTISGFTSLPANIDGITSFSNGDRFLIKEQTDQKQNGIFAVSGTTLVRAIDHDGAPVGEVGINDYTFVTSGSTLIATSWVIGNTNAADANVITPGVDTQIWRLFSESKTYGADGQAIKLQNGNTFYLDTDETGVYGSGLEQSVDGVRILPSILGDLSGNTSSILSISSEISTLNSTDVVLSTALSTEISNRISGDVSLSTALSTDINSLSTAVSTEMSSLGSVDLSLSTDISSLQSTDVVLSNEISTVSSTVSDLSTGLYYGLSTETSNRVWADNSLSTAFSNELSTEISNRISGDESVSTAVSNEISTEISNRISGDESLSTAVSVVISSETSSRISGDESLSTVISTLEASLSSNVSSDSSLSLALSSEISNRISGDESLSTVVSTEVSNRVSGDESLSTVISTLNNSVSTDISTLSNDLSTEISNRVSGDESLSTAISTLDNSVSGDISTLSTDLSTVSSDLSTEISNRLSGDESLSTLFSNALSIEISTEISNRISGDESLSTAVSTQLSTEVSTLNSADESLSTAVSTQLSTEVSTLNSTDIVLSNAISGLGTALDGNGLTYSGTTLNVNVDGFTIKIVGDELRGQQTWIQTTTTCNVISGTTGLTGLVLDYDPITPVTAYINGIEYLISPNTFAIANFPFFYSQYPPIQGTAIGFNATIAGFGIETGVDLVTIKFSYIDEA